MMETVNHPNTNSVEEVKKRLGAIIALASIKQVLLFEYEVYAKAYKKQFLSFVCLAQTGLLLSNDRSCQERLPFYRDCPMIAIAKLQPKPSTSWQSGFLVLMPDIVKSASIAFRDLDPEAHQEGVQEVVVSSMLAYVRQLQRNKVEVAYASALARYAIAQYRSGRRVSASLNCNDVLSPYARDKKNFRVQTQSRNGPLA